MTLGPLAVDVIGTQLTPIECEYLSHPLVGAVVLFARNYENPQQLQQLVQSIKALKSPQLFVAVDQEGGRIQRFNKDFTRLPVAHSFAFFYDKDPQSALQQVEQTGWLMASELLACGVDFSFAPVLDIADKRSRIINERGFHQDPSAIIALAGAYIAGMNRAGMAAIGKHFPGHGSIIADTHVQLSRDLREWKVIEQHDLQPFIQLSPRLAGIMTAHIIYADIDQQPASSSLIWLRTILRQQLQFQGIVFSDDLNMQGIVMLESDPVKRVENALIAGCDVAIFCNRSDLLALLLDNLQPPSNAQLAQRWQCMSGKSTMDWYTLRQQAEWKIISRQVEQFRGENNV